MIVTINYDITELEETARFIWKNNPNIKSIIDAYDWVTPDNLVKHILRLTYRLIKDNAHLVRNEKKTGIVSTEFQNSVGTMGFIISTYIESNEDNILSFKVDYLVNPAIGIRYSGMVTEVVDVTHE